MGINIARGVGLLSTVVTVIALAGCGTAAGAEDEAADDSVVGYLKGSWSCSANVTDVGIVVVDVTIDGNSMSFVPPEGAGGRVDVNYAEEDGQITFDDGIYVRIPDSMPAVGETLTFAPAIEGEEPQDGALRIEVTRLEGDKADVVYWLQEDAIDYACQRG